MNEFQLLAIGALFGLGSGIIIQLVIHVLSSQREKNNWQKDKIRRKEERDEQEKEKAEVKLLKLQSENNELQKEIVKYERDILDHLVYGIILMNQLRDALLGYDQAEQFRRADEMREILSKLSKEELEQIANKEKPLPELPGKPKSISS